MTEKAVAGSGRDEKHVVKAVYAPRLLKLMIGLTLVLLLTHLLLQYLNLEVFHEKHGQIFELSNRFDFDDEASFPTWVSQAVFLAFGVSAFLAAKLEVRTARRSLWRVLGVFGVLISIDEILGLHETFLQTVHVLFFGESAPRVLANAWWIVLPFVFGLSGWLLGQMIRHFPRYTVVLFIIGGIAYLTGAAGVDILTNSVSKTTFLSQGILVAIEETLELTGALLFLYAVLNYLETYHYDVLSRIAKELKKTGAE